MSHRSLGTSRTAFPPERKNCQNDSGSLLPPGKRQAIPTMAMGSRRASSVALSCACISCSFRYACLIGESGLCFGSPFTINLLFPSDRSQLLEQQPFYFFIRQIFDTQRLWPNLRGLVFR